MEILQKEIDEFEQEDDALFEIINATDRFKYTQLLAEHNDRLTEEVEEKTAHIRNMQA